MSGFASSPEATLSVWSTPPEGATAWWYQERGRAFEGIIQAVLFRDGLKPRTHFRPEGEEVDGSFVLHQRTFLLEAKWRKDPRPASDLYAFRGKVDGKLVGTIGVFISMSGYSTDAIDALKYGKEINLILFNEQDFRLVCSGSISFAEAMERKLRYAAEEGQPFLPLAPNEATEVSAVDVSSPVEAVISDSPERWDFVVEGEADGIGIGTVLERLGKRDHVRIWVAGGQMAVPGLVRHLQAERGHQVAAIIEADAPARLVDQLQREMPKDPENLVIVDTSVEDWLEDACDADYVNAAPPTSSKQKSVRLYASNADLKKLLGGASAISRLLSRVAT